MCPLEALLFNEHPSVVTIAMAETTDTIALILDIVFTFSAYSMSVSACYCNQRSMMIMLMNGVYSNREAEIR